MPIQILNDRQVVAATGPDAGDLLQGLVTANIETIAENSVVPCALLTPQGKIAFDFLLGKLGDDGYFFDMRSALVDDFQKRMTLYKLRANVTIAPIDDWTPAAIWNEEFDASNTYRDERFRSEDKVMRVYQNADFDVETGEFDNIRIQNFVAESDGDFEINDIFPHDVYFDLNGGIDFKKGCYVGQEVVSRMQHRSSARKRIALIQSGEVDLSSGQDITANGKPIGKLGTVSNKMGLAIIRVDRYFDAISANHPVQINDADVSVTFPEWAKDAIEPYKGAS